MKNILLYPNVRKDSALTLTTTVARQLVEYGFTVYISENFSLDATVE